MNRSYSPDEQKALLCELASLSGQQSDARQTAVYLPMSKEEFAQYEEPAKRINELSVLTKTLKTE